MRLFLDTSAFAKRYVAENGSDKVLELCGCAEQLAVSVMCLPEAVSTLSRLVQERRLSAAAYRALKQSVLEDLTAMDICEMTVAVMSGVIELLETSAIRALDAIHVACAVAYRADIFVSADVRQLAAARKAGLLVQDVS